MCENRYTAVKASHAVGKTFVAAVAACWWYDCWERNIVYVNAPNWNQCLGLTFKQAKQFRLQHELPGEILDTGLVRDEIRVRQTDHFIRAVNAQSGEGFQGEHAAPILIILDEATGVLPHIWEASRGLMTSETCRLLAIFNPTDEATQAGKLTKRPNVNVITISALKHPNILAELQGKPQPFPGACSLLWLTEMLEDECELVASGDPDAFEFWALSVLKAALASRPGQSGDPRCWYRPTAYFQGRVLGMFPTLADEQVIPRAWLESCPPIAPESVLPQIGCDVARYGSDRTVIVIRRGPHPLWLREIRQMDTVLVAQALRDAAEKACDLCGLLPDQSAKSLSMKIDVTGGLGAGPFDILKHEGYRVVPANVSASAANKELFKNKRSEQWFVMRERLREKRIDFSLLPRAQRDALFEELATPKYTVKASGHKVVEDKDEIKKRLGNDMSPDMADALLLSYTDFGKWWEDPELIAWLKSFNSPKPAEAPKEPIEGNAFLTFAGQ